MHLKKQVLIYYLPVSQYLFNNYNSPRVTSVAREHVGPVLDQHLRSRGALPQQSQR